MNYLLYVYQFSVLSLLLVIIHFSISQWRSVPHPLLFYYFFIYTLSQSIEVSFCCGLIVCLIFGFNISWHSILFIVRWVSYMCYVCLTIASYRNLSYDSWFELNRSMNEKNQLRNFWSEYFTKIVIRVVYAVASSPCICFYIFVRVGLFWWCRELWW